MNKFFPVCIVLLWATNVVAQPATIPMEISRNGHLMVKARVNGVEGNFIFDTGAGFHVISKTFYNKIRHHVKDSTQFTGFRHTGERLDGPMYKFETVSLGALSQREPWIGVYAGFDNMGFDGLISCKLIENHIVTIDPRSKQMVIETSKSLSGKKGQTIPLLLHADRDRHLDIFIPIKIDNQFNAIVEFDTGAGYSPLYLHSRYIHYTSTDTTALEARNAETGFGKHEKTYLDKRKKIKIHVPGTGEVVSPNIVFKPNLIYDGLTSYIIFGDKPFTIDIKNRKMYLWD